MILSMAAAKRRRFPNLLGHLWAAASVEPVQILPSRLQWSRRSRWVWLGAVVSVALWIVTLSGCEEDRKPGDQIFQEAEKAFRLGDYDKALTLYQEFLEQNPNSPLTSIAEQRIMSIEREFKSVMGKKRGLHPIYLKPADPDDGSTNEGQPE